MCEAKLLMLRVDNDDSDSRVATLHSTSSLRPGESENARNRPACFLVAEGGTRSQFSKLERTGHFHRSAQKPREPLDLSCSVQAKSRIWLSQIRPCSAPTFFTTETPESQALVDARSPVVTHFEQIKTFGQSFQDRVTALAEQQLSWNLSSSIENPLDSFICHLNPIVHVGPCKQEGSCSNGLVTSMSALTAIRERKR